MHKVYFPPPQKKQSQTYSITTQVKIHDFSAEVGAQDLTQSYPTSPAMSLNLDMILCGLKYKLSIKLTTLGIFENIAGEVEK